VFIPLSLALSPEGREDKGIEYGNEFRPKICEQNGVRTQISVYVFRLIVLRLFATASRHI